MLTLFSNYCFSSNYAKLGSYWNFGEFRDREKVVRGIKKEDSVIIDGYQLYHNYIRSHMGLDGKTPAEACGITINGEDKWKTLIQNASRK